jgi:hypothetical protein
MSRILRRPMFRGGPASSDGVGITSGLNDGYATGGRVGYETAGPVGIDLDSSYTDLYSPTSDFYNTMGYVPVKGQYDDNSLNESETLTLMQRRQQMIAEREKQTSGISPRERIGLPLTKTQEMEKKGYNLTGIPVTEQQKIIKQYDQDEANKKAKELSDLALKNSLKKNNEIQFKDNTPTRPSLYDEFSAIINKANLVDQEELTKQKYLELAKFGLNLLKPTPAGIKPSLASSIAAAAEKPLEGYSNILTREAQAKQVPKQLALQATLNAMTPGTFEKNIQGLIRAGLPPQKALEFMTKEATYQQRAQDLKELDYYGEKLTNRFDFLKNKENIKKGLPDSASQSFLNWRKIDPNLTQGQISELPKDKNLAIDKKYYIDPNTGIIIKFDKKINDYREAGEI